MTVSLVVVRIHVARGASPQGRAVKHAEFPATAWGLLDAIALASGLHQQLDEMQRDCSGSGRVCIEIARIEMRHADIELVESVRDAYACPGSRFTRAAAVLEAYKVEAEQYAMHNASVKK